MKIEIELQDEPNTYLGQFDAVDEYIRQNTIKIEDTEFFGITVASVPIIKETNKNTGVKIKPQSTWYEYFVSCRKTKGGIYKFKVWRAE